LRVPSRRCDRHRFLDFSATIDEGATRPAA